MKILFVLLLALGCYANPTGSELKKTPTTAFDFTMVPSNDIKETLQDMIMVEIGKELFLERRKNNLWQCQTDQFGTAYCPTGLATARPYTAYYQSTTYERESAVMDYQTGFSVAGVGQVVDYATNPCPSGFTRDGNLCVRKGKFNCNGNWQYFDTLPYFYDAKQGKVASFEDSDGKVTNFTSGLRYKCTTSSAVRIEQIHNATGKYNETSYGLVFPDINLKTVEETTSFVKEKSAHEGWADTYYYRPGRSDKGGYRSETYRVYMDGMYFSYKRVGDVFTIKVENTYDGEGWTVRDIIETSISLVETQKIAMCTEGYTETTGSEKSKSECKKTINYAFYTYTCPSGYTVANAGLTTCTKTDPDTTKDSTSTLDDACNSTTPPVGNCSKSISYKYYEYLCQAKNSFLEPIKNLNTGLKSPCSKTDSDKTKDNTGTLDDACNSSTPPTNNCQSTEYTCNSALFKPVYVGGKWVCSPYLCNDDMKCGYGTCDLPTTPSATKYQDIAYNPLGTVNDNKCNGDICDFVVNARVTYCESKQCPKGDDIIEKNGKCYKLECPAGTYLSGEKCIKVN